MANILSLALVQFDIVWHDTHANIQKVQDLCASVSADVYILPEMFHTGFTMEPQNVPKADMQAAQAFLQNMSKEKAALVVGGTVQEDGGKFYNRLFAYDHGTLVAQYDKRHLFSFAQEPKHYAPGNEAVQLEYQGWKIAPFTCYDLRFPVFTRNSKEAPFDLQLFIASWPEARISAWDTLLHARAIENQCYVVGVNRVGEDGSGISYVGHSRAVDPYGKTQLEFADGEEAVKKIDIDKEALDRFRSKFPVLEDADRFTLH